MEPRGAYEGLKLAKERGFRFVDLQMNSEGGGRGSHSGWCSVGRFGKLLDSDWRVHVSHVYREVNKSVDVLANLGCREDNTLVVYEHTCASSSGLAL